MYNITGIILQLENFFEQKHVGAIIAISFCIGGNDFLPNFHGISHESILTAVTTDKNILSGLIRFTYKPSGEVLKCTIDEEMYLKLMKKLYCPNNLNEELLSLEEVSQLAIKPPNKSEFRHPQSWMPPETALKKLCQRTQCQIDYLMTCYDHSADLPDFLSKGCLLKSKDGDVVYDLGENIHTGDKTSLLTIPEDHLSANLIKAKIVQRKSKKRGLVVTPQQTGACKRQPMISTPR